MIKDSIYHTLMCLTEFQEVLQDHNSFFGGKGFGMELNPQTGRSLCRIPMISPRPYER